MLILLHVTIAVASIGLTGYTYSRPSAVKLNLSYGLVLLTLISGTYLVISTHSPMLQSCMGGLIYLGVILAGIISARQKMVEAKSTQKQPPS